MSNEIDTATFYAGIRKAAFLPSDEAAARWTAAILKTLGINLSRGTKKRLAAALPREFAEPLTRVFWLLHFRNKAMPAAEFAMAVARRADNSDNEYSLKVIRAVFASLKNSIDEKMADSVEKNLAPEVADLWKSARIAT